MQPITANNLTQNQKRFERLRHANVKKPVFALTHC
jgi:hypothetical protein